MTLLSDVFDPALLDAAIEAGHVSVRDHATEPLAILNYTNAATYDRAWNACVLACRGLIYRTDTHEVVARPFPKFFNHGEPCAPDLDMGAEAVVTDKLDGSLGILYPTSDGFRVATRGSFHSEQAEEGTGLWEDYYIDVSPPEGWTPLFEIIYPANRIVLDYGNMEDLVLLGAVEIATGKSVHPDHQLLAFWPGPRAEVFHYRSLAEALTGEPRPNAEGLVVHLPGTDERVKLKQEDYVALHRIVTGLNERTVWEHMRGGGPVDDLLEPLPEEFHPWVERVAGRMVDAVDAARMEVELEFAAIRAALPTDHTRKDFALVAKDSPRRAMLFARLDDRPYTPMLWDACRPGATPPESEVDTSLPEPRRSP